MAKEVLTHEELKHIFIAKDKFQRTAWNMAADRGKIEVLHKLWEWAKEALPQEELRNIFLAKDEFERTDWYMTADKVQINYYTNCGSGLKRY